MKIVVLNQHGSNYGDDAAIAAALLQLNRLFPGSAFHLVYNYQDDVDGAVAPDIGVDVTHHLNLQVRKYDVIQLGLAMIVGRAPVRRWLTPSVRELLALLSDADLVFVSPCGANIGIYRDWAFLGRIIAAVVCGHRPIFHLNTIGLSGDRRFDLLARLTLPRCDVFVRERRSYDLLKARGIGVMLGADTAFALPALPKAAPSDEVILVATDVRRWFETYADFDNERFETQLCAAVGSVARARGLTVRLIPHLHGVMDERAHLDDLAARLRAEGVARVVVDDIYPSHEGYERAIADARAVVSMRYHGVVLAAKNAVPFVSLSYENKMFEAARYTGFETQSIDLRGLTLDRVRAALDHCLDHEAEIRVVLKERAGDLRELAQLPARHAWILRNT